MKWTKTTTKTKIDSKIYYKITITIKSANDDDDNEELCQIRWMKRIELNWILERETKRNETQLIFGTTKQKRTEPKITITYSN